MELLILALLAVCVCLLGYLAVSHYRTQRPHDYSKDPDIIAWHKRHPEAPWGPVPLTLAPAVSVTVGPDEEGAPQSLPVNERYTPAPVEALHAARPTTTVLARVWPAVMHWLTGARTMHPHADPLLTAEQTREARVIQSAIVEHGQLIEAAILEATKQSPDLTAWQEPAFRLSHMATVAQKTGTAEGVARANLPYGDGTEDHSTIQVDLIAFDHRANVIRAYEIKRKADPGQWSAANLATVQMLLLDYARSKTINGVALDPVKAETFLICYYGTPHGGNKITRSELDKHFDAPVIEHVEEATAKFRRELQALIAKPASVEAGAKDKAA